MLSWNVLMIILSILGTQLERRSVVSRGVKPWMNRLGKAVMRDQWTARWVRNKCTVNGGIPVVRAKKYQSAPFTAAAYSPLAGGWTSTPVTEESKRSSVKEFSSCLVGTSARISRECGLLLELRGAKEVVHTRILVLTLTHHGFYW